MTIAATLPRSELPLRAQALILAAYLLVVHTFSELDHAGIAHCPLLKFCGF